MEACAGTGMGQCTFNWRDGERIAAIATYGDDKLFDSMAVNALKTVNESIQTASPTGETQKAEVGSASSNSKYARTKEDVALQCHFKDPRSANSWIYLIDSDKNEVNKLFKIENNKVDISHNIDRKRTSGSEIVFDVTSSSTSLMKIINPSAFDPSDYEKFTIDRSTLDMNNEVFTNKLSSYPSNYKFVCELMSSEMYVRLIDDIKERRAATKAKEANNKI